MAVSELETVTALNKDTHFAGDLIGRAISRIPAKHLELKTIPAFGYITEGECLALKLKDPKAMQVLFTKMFKSSSRIAWRMDPHSMARIYLRYLVIFWQRQAEVVCCICYSSNGGWGSKGGSKNRELNLPGENCRAPFKCRLVKPGNSLVKLVRMR